MPGLFLILSSLFIACDQEPLFWDIAHEYPPIEPLIKGSPSKIIDVTYSNPARTVLYVSNGDIWEWDTSTSSNPNWREMGPQPGGKIKTVASAAGCLFSLDWDGKIKKFDGSTWSSVSGTYGKPEQLFGAENYLFAGSLTGAPGTSTGYSIFGMAATNDSGMTLIKSDTGLLMGAAENGGKYYLGTRGGGIVSTSSSLDDTVPEMESSSIVGLIKHGTTVVAVTTRREILYSSGGAFTSLGLSTTYYYSGAMASWENDNGDRLLLLGLLRSSGSFGFGYRELMWKSGENIDTDGRLYTPGEDALSSVQQGSQYTSAIGNHAVLALYAIPPDSPAIKADGEDRPIVFASTLKEGLWSYRTRKDVPQWNGEDNSN